MIINHKYKFIFIKTKKTAGTSIEIALSQFCGSEDIITRIDGKDEKLRQQLGFNGPQNFQVPLLSYGLSDWRNLLFTGQRKVFRNHLPARLIRNNIGEKIWQNYFKFCFERNPFDRAVSLYYWRARKFDSYLAIDEFVNSVPANLLSNWGIYAIDDSISVDFVGRYENLGEDLLKVSQILDFPNQLTLSGIEAKGNYRQSREHYSKIINNQARDRIEKVCAKEIAAFSYEWCDI